jgi:hypothetical protein
VLLSIVMCVFYDYIQISVAKINEQTSPAFLWTKSYDLLIYESEESFDYDAWKSLDWRFLIDQTHHYWALPKLQEHFPSEEEKIFACISDWILDLLQCDYGSLCDYRPGNAPPDEIFTTYGEICQADISICKKIYEIKEKVSPAARNLQTNFWETKVLQQKEDKHVLWLQTFQHHSIKKIYYASAALIDVVLFSSTQKHEWFRLTATVDTLYSQYTEPLVPTIVVKKSLNIEENVRNWIQRHPVLKVYWQTNIQIFLWNLLKSHFLNAKFDNLKTLFCDEAPQEEDDDDPQEEDDDE